MTVISNVGGDTGERRQANASDHLGFIDGAGKAWQVWERDSRKDPGAHAASCLIFTSHDSFRRVWIYPAAWRDLASTALVALSWQR